jgi:hypothetical protein
MRLSYLVKGLPAHPLHPPLTDATIGIYTREPSHRAVAPVRTPEKELAERSSE